MLATGATDGTARIWESSTGREITTLHPKESKADVPGLAVAWHPDSTALAFISRTELALFDIARGQLIKSFMSFTSELIGYPEGTLVTPETSHRGTW